MIRVRFLPDRQPSRLLGGSSHRLSREVREKGSRVVRWFKHMTDASENDFLVRVEGVFGLAAYARWWKLLEIVGKHVGRGENCAAAYPITKWQAALNAKGKTLSSFLDLLEKEGRISVQRSESVLRIEVPNLLK